MKTCAEAAFVTRVCLLKGIHDGQELLLIQDLGAGGGVIVGPPELSYVFQDLDGDSELGAKGAVGCDHLHVGAGDQRAELAGAGQQRARFRGGHDKVAVHRQVDALLCLQVREASLAKGEPRLVQVLQRLESNVRRDSSIAQTEHG